MATMWFEDITLDLIAKDAEVTVMTVIRRFGGKEGLLEAAHLHLGKDIEGRRAAKPGDFEAAVNGLARDYEEICPLVMRMLAQEDRYPPLKVLGDIGRRNHRAMVAEVFVETLGKLPPAKRTAMLDALVIAMDIYIWKLVRVDMERPVAAYKTIVKTMIHAALHMHDDK
jgi:AcrR family transcriptional regulator